MTWRPSRTSRECREINGQNTVDLAIYQFCGKVVDIGNRCVIQGFRSWRKLETHHGRHQGNCGQLWCGTQTSPAETTKNPAYKAGSSSRDDARRSQRQSDGTCRRVAAGG